MVKVFTRPILPFKWVAFTLHLFPESHLVVSQICFWFACFKKIYYYQIICDNKVQITMVEYGIKYP